MPSLQHDLCSLLSRNSIGPTKNYEIIAVPCFEIFLRTRCMKRSSLATFQVQTFVFLRLGHRPF